MMKAKSWVTIISMIMTAWWCPAQDVPETNMRSWVSARGSTIEAEFVSLRMDDVTLRKADGGEVRIRMQQLSPNDQVYIRNLTSQPANTPKKAAAAPVANSGLEKLFGRQFVKANKEETPIDSLAGKKIGLYFSAHWCGPCRAFTPKLVETYNQLSRDGKPFEVIFVSSDRSEDDMFNYMKEAGMPWLAVPFQAKEREQLMKKFNVSGIPKLVVINASGKTLSDEARSDVADRGAKAFDRW